MKPPPAPLSAPLDPSPLSALAPARQRGLPRPTHPIVRKTLIVVALLAVWEAAVRLFNVSPLLFPPPSDVLRVFAQTSLSGELLQYTWQSLLTLSLGMAIGVALALLLVSLATFSRLVADIMETLTAMLNPVPAVALLPLALLWFGLNIRSLIFVIVHAVLWPMYLNLYTGFSAVPITLVRVGQNFGLRGGRLVVGILLPATFPYILSGLKIAWAFAWRTMIASELVFGVTGSKGGLGWFIYTNRYNLNTAHVFAGLLMVILIGLLVENGVFRAVERVTVRRWGMQSA